MLMVLRSHQLFSRELVFHILRSMMWLSGSVRYWQDSHICSMVGDWIRGDPSTILAPARELAWQIQKVILALRDYVGATCHVCIGVTSVLNKMQNCRPEHHILLFCTPGRVSDVLNNYLFPKWVKMLVLGEADKMLSWGFKDQIYEIFQKLNTDIQVMLFSAIRPTVVLELTKIHEKPNSNYGEKGITNPWRNQTTLY